MNPPIFGLTSMLHLGRRVVAASPVPKGCPHVSRPLRNVGFHGPTPLEILLIHPTLSRTLKPKRTMPSENPRRILGGQNSQATPSRQLRQDRGSAARHVAQEEEPDRWLLENREEGTIPIPSSLR